MKRLFWIFGAVVFLAAGCSAQSPVQPTVAPTQVVSPTPTPTVNPSASGGDQANGNFPSSVPSGLASLSGVRLFKGTDSAPADPTQFEYFQVPSIAVGSSNLVLAVDGECDGEGCAPVYFRFLQNGSSYTLLSKYSAPVDGSSGVSKDDLVTANVSAVDVPALDVPTQLKDPSSGAVVALEAGSFTEGDLFNQKGLKLFFTSSGYGVFATNNPADNTDFETFSVEAPDGKALTYDLKDLFLPQNPYGQSSLDIQWNPGIQPATDYSFDSLDTCGEGQDYVDAVNKNPISQGDLIAVGTDRDSGQPVYAIKNTSNPILRAVEAQDQSLASLGQNSSGQPVQYQVLYWKDPFGRLVRFKDFLVDACGGKPVIYLYPTKPMDVTVQVAPAGGMSASDPAYGSGWNVLAQPDGALTLSGKQYPYLFWEGGLGTYKIPEKGFVVQEQDVKQLLDAKLTLIGLNMKEVSDFEQFWLPKMHASPYYFVTFTTNSDVDQFAPLTISPKPDTVIRVLMDYRPLQGYEAVAPLELQRTERAGFTAVEWGGILR